MHRLLLLLISGFLVVVLTASASTPRLVALPDTAPHGAALIESVDLAAGVLRFAWVTADGTRADSGGSFAAFAPRPETVDQATGEITPGAALTDAEIVAAIVAPEPLGAVPTSVSRRQLKQWLIVADKLAAVEGALNAIADPTRKAIALNWWVESQDFERSHPLVAAIAAAPAVGMSSAEIDQAFREAAGL